MDGTASAKQKPNTRGTFFRHCLALHLPVPSYSKVIMLWGRSMADMASPQHPLNCKLPHLDYRNTSRLNFSDCRWPTGP